MLDSLHKLKKKIEKQPFQVIQQPKTLTCPIYLFDLNEWVDAKSVVDICKKYQTDEYKESATQSVYAWRSDYIHKNFNRIPEFDLLFHEVEDKCSSIISWPYKFVIDHYWFAIYNKGEYAKEHSHGFIDMASVYYASVPKNSAPLIIPSLTGDVTITPKEGMLVVFPGYCNHMVPKSDHDGERIIVAMNLLQYTTITCDNNNK